MANFSQSTTARLHSISGYLTSPSDNEVDLSPPSNLRPGAGEFWHSYLPQKQSHEWTASSLKMLSRLCNLCAMYENEFDKLTEEDPVATRGNGAKMINPRFAVVTDLLTKIGTLEAFMNLGNRYDSVAAQSARLVNATTDEDGLLQ